MKSTLLNRQLFLTICVVSALSSSALAQKGGGGGGGTEVGTPLSFTSAAVIGGQIPTWSGNYTITPSAPGYYSWDLASVSIKGKPINLFDGAPMRLTAYFSDSLTGMPLETVSGPYFYCMKKVGATKADFIL